MAEEKKGFSIDDLKKHLTYKWRVQSTNGKKAYNNQPAVKPTKAKCVAYIDARDAQSLLDSVCGAENWSSEYYEVKGSLFCRLGIKIDGEWIYKSDNGSVSKVEPEKGASSDAFKRAGVMWGIGRFLYSIPMQTITCNEWGRPTGGDGKPIWDALTNEHFGFRPKYTMFDTHKEAMLDKLHNGDATVESILEGIQKQFTVPDDIVEKIKELK